MRSKSRYKPCDIAIRARLALKCSFALNSWFMVVILFGLPNGIALGQDLTPSQDPVQSESCASKGEGPNVLDGSTLTPDEVVRLIDREISLGYDKMGVDPAVRCTDEAFIRRVYLDLAGRIPTRDERQEFLSDSSQTKRVDWIDRILASEDYVQHFASVFDTLLMGRKIGRAHV